VWEMNDEPLLAIYSLPLRVLVLGYISARSVKWLYCVKAIKNPSLAPVQSKEYLYFDQQTGKHNLRPTNRI
jgi:sulfite oxidase